MAEVVRCGSHAGGAPIRSAVAVGTFDGVHLGHRAVLDAVVSEAVAQGTRSVAVTFDRHPLAYFRPTEPPLLLTGMQEKSELLCASGVDEVAVVAFSKDIADMSVEAFVEFLVSQFACECIVMGHDNALGRNRLGTPAYVQSLAGSMGFRLRVVEPIEVEGVVVSSTEIRSRLSVGDVTTSALLLGRRYNLRSTVVPGDGRGRRMGVATANLAVPEGRFLPRDGVYATLATIDGTRELRQSVTNIGYRPTFYGGVDGAERTLEVHLLDANEDVYGRQIRLEFVSFLRSERSFADREELVAQIQQDILMSRRVLGHPPSV